MSRTLYLHAGGAKAGSSALQCYTALRLETLRREGIAYPLHSAPPLSIGSGNGMTLFNTLTQPAVAPSAVDTAVMLYFGDLSNALCSCEYFQQLRARELSILLSSCQRLDIQLKTFFYVRNVIPYFVSIYNQSIKHSGQLQEFSEAIETVKWEHGDFLECAYEFGSALGLTVESYDTNKTDIFTRFALWLGHRDDETIDYGTVPNGFNRSLTLAEQALVMKISAKLGVFVARDLASHITSSRPDIIPDMPVPEEVSDALVRKHQVTVDRVNAKYFNGQPVVRVEGYDKGLPMEAGASREQMAAVEDVFIDWCCRTLDKGREINVFEAASMIQTAAHLAAFGPPDDPAFAVLPDQFDPVAYLVLNPDLILARIDPWYHFRVHGLAEGRLYRFPRPTASD